MNGMTVGEMAALCGVSVRTLHYYDRIGLLRPEQVEENGYRRYGDASVRRLWQILFFRELGFPLREIGQILSAPDYDAQQALRRQRQLLLLERERLERLLASLDAHLKGDKIMDFKGFDTKDADRARAEYAAEAKARWGNTDAWKESQRRDQSRTQEEQAALTEEMNAIFRRFAALAGTDPADPAVQAALENWRMFIDTHYYPCSEEILAGLGQMYVGDERFRQNLDRFGPGTAELMSAAIAVRCGN